MNSSEPQNRTRVRDTAVIVASIIGAGLVISWLLLGRRATEKIGTELIMPLGMITLLTLLVLVHETRRRCRAGAVSALAILTLLLIAGNSIVGRWSVSHLESRYATIDPLKIEDLSTLIVLGGAVRQTPYGGPQVNRNGDRLVTAARLFHRGKIEKVYCTGKRTAEISTLLADESELTATLLAELGVPAETIVQLGGRNTTEEMTAIAAEVGDRPVGILTSAWHLPRAMRLAKSSGINAVAVPSDFIGAGAAESLPVAAAIRDCIPSQAGLTLNTRAMKEVIAWILGR